MPDLVPVSNLSWRTSVSLYFASEVGGSLKVHTAGVCNICSYRESERAG